MKPYYQHAGIEIYHGDCLEVLSTLQGPIDTILTDPPYGISYRSNHNSSRRGKWAKWVRYENFDGIVGDDKPLDPTHLPDARAVIIFGGNYCADMLPPSRCWLVWDKRDGIGPNNQADCEMAWTNLYKPSRIHRQMWSGLLRAGRENVALQSKQHPHQKPIALMKFCLEYADTCGLVLDPYCGSGSTMLAAKELGLPAIGIEIEEAYCEIAASRLSQDVFDFNGAT